MILGLTSIFLYFEISYLIDHVKKGPRHKVGLIYFCIVFMIYELYRVKNYYNAGLLIMSWSEEEECR